VPFEAHVILNSIARKHTPCDYGLATSYRSAVDNVAREERVWTADGSPAFSTAASSTRERNSTSALTDPLSDITSDILSPNNLQISDEVDRRVYSQVLRIIEGTGLYVDDVTSRYFNGIHKWLPVISRPRFNRRILADQGSPSAASAILLLSITLISQPPPSDSTREDNLNAMYLSAKMLFAQVQVSVPSSLCLIQAGLLISTYERAHSLFEAAYISIGTCARMAFAAGLHRRRSIIDESDREAWSQREEEKNLWWGIVMCDR
jgi:hypothetical protein